MKLIIKKYFKISLLIVIGLSSSLSLFGANIFNEIKKGNLKEVKKLLKPKGKISVNVTDKDGKTPLYLACLFGHTDIVKELLKHKNINVNAALADGANPLIAACIKGYTAIVKELLKHPNINVNALGQHKDVTPLFFACQNKKLEIVKLLLENGAKVDNKSKKDGSEKIIKYLILVEEYNDPKKDTLQLILKNQNNFEFFNFLVRLAFGHAIQSELKNILRKKELKDLPIRKLLEKTIFFSKIYDNKIIKKKLKKIFGVGYNADILKFIRDVVKNKKNVFSFDLSILKKTSLKKPKKGTWNILIKTEK